MRSQYTLAVAEGHIEPKDMTARYSVHSLGDWAQAETKTVVPLVAIVIACDEERHRLTEVLRALDTQVVAYQDLRTLRACLISNEVDLVITDATLPDANWADVLRLIVRTSLATDLLVHSRTADEGLRSEVMWRGACGIVAPPYSAESISGVTRNTLRSHAAPERKSDSSPTVMM